MGIKREQMGFTIIETMFFLAISGMMMVGLAAAMSNMINNQRYQDSVNRLKNNFQAEYNSVVNVNNDRLKNYKCSGDGVKSLSGASAATGLDRGTTNCTLLGRFIVFNSTNGNSKYKSYPVYGTTAVDLDKAMKDSTSTDWVSEYKPKVSFDVPSAIQDNSIDWSYQWSLASASATNKSIGIAIVRSPESGVVTTFVKPLLDSFMDGSDSNITKINTALNNTLMLGEKKISICVKDGSSAKSMVSITAGGSGSSSVSVESARGC